MKNYATFEILLFEPRRPLDSVKRLRQRTARHTEVAAKCETFNLYPFMKPESFPALSVTGIFCFLVRLTP